MAIMSKPSTSNTLTLLSRDTLTSSDPSWLAARPEAAKNSSKQQKAASIRGRSKQQQQEQQAAEQAGNAGSDKHRAAQALAKSGAINGNHHLIV
jgi:hypothetical protein